MNLWIFIIGLAAVVQPAYTNCGNSAVLQSPAVYGPGESKAVLRISAEDDHAKETHLCMADYKLEITHAADQPQTVELMSSDNEWGRKISIGLSGFSADGQKIFGKFSEGGSAPVEQMFEYDTDDGNVRFFELGTLAAHIASPKCIAKAQVIGTTAKGAIAIRMDTGKNCDRWSRWQLSSVRGPLQRLPKHATVQSLYQPGSGRR